MKIIITAAGNGKRFKEIGIDKPKWKICAKGQSLFYWSIHSFENFINEEFIFIFRKQNFDQQFIESELKRLNIKKYEIILIDHLTEGQAQTAMLADKFINDDESIIIYNIDTAIEPSALNKKLCLHDGSIVVSKMLGDHWSFAKVDKNNIVTQVSEKVRISDYASVGLYYFAKWKDFKWVYNNYKNEIKSQYKEIYVAPMYQYLINQGKKITIFEIELSTLTCLGTPEEVSDFDSDWLEEN